MLSKRIKEHLCTTPQDTLPLTYQALAAALELTPPHTIHQLTVALEQLIKEDAAAKRPLIAALVISKARGGLPAPGFFDAAQRAGRYIGALSGPEAVVFYESEFAEATAFWNTDAAD